MYAASVFSTKPFVATLTDTDMTLAPVFQSSSINICNHVRFTNKKHFHEPHSKPPHLSRRKPSPSEAVEVDKTPRRIDPFPELRDRIHQVFLQQNDSSGCHSEPQSTSFGSRFVMMASWMKVKTQVPKFTHANVLALFFVGLLALFPVTFGSIRNSHALDNVRRAEEAVLGTAQDAPLLAVVGTASICGAVALSWLWGNSIRSVWRTEYAFVHTFQHSVLTFGMAFVNVCVAYGRQWIITVFRTAIVTTTTTLVAFVIYILYEGISGSAWEEQPAMKEARVA